MLHLRARNPDGATLITDPAATKAFAQNLAHM